MIKQRRDPVPCYATPNGPPAQAMIPADDEAPARARAYVRDLLDHDDQPLSDDRRDEVVLIVSELVTNAYRYGTEPGDSLLVVVMTTSERVRIEVHDPSRRRPHMRTESGERSRGRGLHIVHALAARWDVVDRPLGKAVWAEVTR
ncbi:Histidine kinase-, DNA gyrase B-, and HSP90-like ATPase [Streptomyces sp. YIM 121038]|uniref:ATP-binding protein n=1 Tax=Streptomyces sp. YIM 121038 TaxID=2136401 RepID=UPI001110F6E0|nr:ATP-binding protein [Streptomyces sp. YIM 121038]QCX77683.1 Histidine kinase-, DNA gyrase B-, and HSP90-like ATPase [Streptomyces sp. YIM 121038]